MPSEGITQIPAGVVKKCSIPGKKELGKRTMKSRNKEIESSLVIDNLQYTGNAVLKANKG
mgnify:CR=1 FL=1|tara:strand:- start:1911 stop:2090 length:180 start_codon:yes stop_codon:yes gene_type:complete